MSQENRGYDSHNWASGETTPNTHRSQDFELEVGSDLSRAATAPRPNSRIPDGADLARLNTLSRSNTIRMTTDAFEKLYLSPQNRVSGHLRQTFGVPTPIALVGFSLSAGPLACSLMGWRGSGGAGMATIGASYFFGGLLQVLGGVMEWLVGNTFPFVCFTTFGAFFLSYATMQNPQYGAQASFLANATTPEEKAAAIASYQASLGFFWLFLAITVFLLLVCSLRTNIVFVANMILIEAAVCFLTGACWRGAEGDAEAQRSLSVASGACVFATCLIGYYLLFAQLLEAVAFPLDLPVGDLSSRFGRRKEVPNTLPKQFDV